MTNNDTNYCGTTTQDMEGTNELKLRNNFKVVSELFDNNNNNQNSNKIESQRFGMPLTINDKQLNNKVKGIINRDIKSSIFNNYINNIIEEFISFNNNFPFHTHIKTKIMKKYYQMILVLLLQCHTKVISVYHCKSGLDRTGLMFAITESVKGFYLVNSQNENFINLLNELISDKTKNENEHQHQKLLDDNDKNKIYKILKCLTPLQHSLNNTNSINLLIDINNNEIKEITNVGESFFKVIFIHLMISYMITLWVLDYQV